MDYEQKYKEALKDLKKIKDANKDNKELVDFINYKYPELRESEDERIRKVLVELVKCNERSGYFMFNNITTSSMLAWLEKQGEKNTHLPSFDELQGTPILKQGEQKHTDKVEPKFKVGDWVVWDNKISCYVDNIYQGKESLMYTTIDTNNTTHSYSVKCFDNNAHLWTIQDAKDGDVLATKKGNPFIYDKNRYNNGLAYYYAGIDANEELTLKSPHHMLSHFGELRSVFPATKEQRDLLFQKMKEARYKWDNNKKELVRYKQ